MSLVQQNEIAYYAGTQQSLDEHKYGGDEGPYRARGSNTPRAPRSLCYENSESECDPLSSCLSALNISEEITEVKENEKEKGKEDQ